jgi:hypothetical protein
MIEIHNPRESEVERCKVPPPQQKKIRVLLLHFCMVYGPEQFIPTPIVRKYSHYF